MKKFKKIIEIDGLNVDYDLCADTRDSYLLHDLQYLGSGVISGFEAPMHAWRFVKDSDRVHHEASVEALAESMMPNTVSWSPQETAFKINPAFRGITILQPKPTYGLDPSQFSDMLEDLKKSMEGHE